MKLLLVLALGALGFSTVARADIAGCPGFESGSASQETVDHFYALRAVDIVRKATMGDRAKLAPLVAPDASFTIWRGDAATSAREEGVAGIIEMAADLKAASFEYVVVRSGPWAEAPGSCAWSTKVIWRTADRAAGVSVIFDFEDGRMTRAMGTEVAIAEGEI